ncbi:MAG: hypothetical protein QM730_12025 [Anaerolineales bacterium]
MLEKSPKKWILQPFVCKEQRPNEHPSRYDLIDQNNGLRTL